MLLQICIHLYYVEEWNKIELNWIELNWGQLPEYFLHCLPEYQVVLPEYYMIYFFGPNMAILKILGGLQPPPPPPASYAYACIYK